MSLGMPVARASGAPTMVPTIITQARTTREPIIRLDREEARVAVAHRTAEARPPRIAVTRLSLAGGGASRAGGTDPGLWYHPRSRPALTPCRGAQPLHPIDSTRIFHLAKTPRT